MVCRADPKRVPDWRDGRGRRDEASAHPPSSPPSRSPIWPMPPSAPVLGALPSGVSMSMIIGRNAARIGRSISTESPDFAAIWFTLFGPSAAPSCCGSTAWFGPVEIHESTAPPRPPCRSVADEAVDAALRGERLLDRARELRRIGASRSLADRREQVRQVHGGSSPWMRGRALAEHTARVRRDCAPRGGAGRPSRAGTSSARCRSRRRGSATAHRARAPDPPRPRARRAPRRRSCPT